MPVITRSTLLTMPESKFVRREILAFAYTKYGHLAYFSIPTDKIHMICESLPSAFMDGSQWDFISKLYRSPDCWCFNKEYPPYIKFLKNCYSQYTKNHSLIVEDKGRLRQDGITETAQLLSHCIFENALPKVVVTSQLFHKTGLGYLLKEAGIVNGWLNISICCREIGILAITEEHSELADMIAGELYTAKEHFFDPFDINCSELVLRFHKTSLDYAQGIDKDVPVAFLDQLKKSLRKFTRPLVYHHYDIDLLDFAGGGFLSAVTGFTLSHYLLKQEIPYWVQQGILGGLCVVSPVFTYGLLLGFVTHECDCNEVLKTTTGIYSFSKDRFDRFLASIRREITPELNYIKKSVPLKKIYDKNHFFFEESDIEAILSPPAIFCAEANQALNPVWGDVLNVVYPDTHPVVLSSSISADNPIASRYYPHSLFRREDYALHYYYPKDTDNVMEQYENRSLPLRRFKEFLSRKIQTGFAEMLRNDSKANTMVNNGNMVSHTEITIFTTNLRLIFIHRLHFLPEPVKAAFFLSEAIIAPGKKKRAELFNTVMNKEKLPPEVCSVICAVAVALGWHPGGFSGRYYGTKEIEALYKLPENHDERLQLFLNTLEKSLLEAVDMIWPEHGLKLSEKLDK